MATPYTIKMDNRGCYSVVTRNEGAVVAAGFTSIDPALTHCENLNRATFTFWPIHPDGSKKRVGEMTAYEQARVEADAADAAARFEAVRTSA